MSDLKQDFSAQMLQDIQPLVQQQDSLEIQNNQMQNCMSELENSFIEGKNPFQTQNQNIYFSDHTPFFKQKPSQLHHSPISSANEGLFNYTQHNTSLSMPDQNYPQLLEKTFQILEKTEKLQPEQSSNKSLSPGEDNLSITEELSESFNEINMGVVGRRGYRRKILPENMNLTHSEHMLLGGKVISGLEKNIVSLPFRDPVDIYRFNIPDYLDIVKQPMDLRTIKRKIFNEEYDNVDQIYTDIELIISNSIKYNQFNPDFVRLTRNFQKSYHKIRRDCERNMRKLKIDEEKKVQTFPAAEKLNKKIPKTIENNFPSNDVEIMSSFEFKDLTKLAKKIQKLQAQEQIQLFKKIGIRDTMVIDIKTLSTKQVRGLMRQVERIEKSKEEFIRNEQKKENSHLTTCDNEYRYAA